MVHPNVMAESSTEPVGLWLGLQAGAFLGLYFGFSLALVSALTSPDELMRIVYLITLFPLAGGILLGPFLAKRERPVASSTPPIQRTMETLEGMDEGQGKWRILSHVRSDGRTVRIDLHDSSRVEDILRLTNPLTNEFPVRYMVGRGVGASVGRGVGLPPTATSRSQPDPCIQHSAGDALDHGFAA